jgi:predicted enzyme related to lactoylglutathione lyase
MVKRDTPPAGAPCWADLWTSDVEGARRFYGELFGWGSEEPNPEFGGYFSFTREGERIAGGMGDMGDMKADNRWKVYFATPDINETLERVQSHGGQIIAPAMPVADLGIQSILVDPGGAPLGLWQPGTHPGFTVLGEHASPSWVELHTRTHARAVDFYRSVFSWEITPVGDTDEFRYYTYRPAGTTEDVGGIMDGTNFRSEGTPDQWDLYWEVDDCEKTAAEVKALGGSVLIGPDPTPYGTLALVADPFGAQFKLRTSPKP